MIDQIVVIYAIVDDLLKAISHSEDIRRSISDTEVITYSDTTTSGSHLPTANIKKCNKKIGITVKINVRLSKKA